MTKKILIITFFLLILIGVAIAGENSYNWVRPVTEPVTANISSINLTARAPWLQLIGAEIVYNDSQLYYTIADTNESTRVEELITSNTTTNGRIDTLNSTKLDITDQRYNETGEFANYYTSSEIDGFSFLTEETDPVFTAWDYNCANITGATSDLCTLEDTTIADTNESTRVEELITSNTTTNGRIDTLNSTKLDITDQRYNETALIPTDSWVNDTGDTMTGNLTLSNGHITIDKNDLLGVFGSSAFADKYIQVRGGSNGIGYFGLDTSLNSGSGAYLIQAGLTKALAFAVNNDTFGSTPNMYIDTAGKVGIGTTSPKYTLDIIGTFSANVDAGNLTLGELPDDRLSANIPELDTANTFTGGTQKVEYTGNANGLWAYSNVGATVSSSLFETHCDNPAYDYTCAYVRNDGTGRGLNVYNYLDGNGEGAGFFGDQSYGTNNYVRLAQGSNATRSTIYAYRNLGSANTGNAVVKVINGNVSDDQSALEVQNDGSAYPLYVDGANAISIYATKNVSAEGFIDRTPFFEGNALVEINKITSIDGKIDHNKLPSFVKASYDEPIMEEQEICNLENEEEVCKNESVKVGSVTKEGRSLGASISLNTVGIQELYDEIVYLEGELCKKDNTYPWCK